MHPLSLSFLCHTASLPVPPLLHLALLAISEGNLSLMQELPRKAAQLEFFSQVFFTPYLKEAAVLGASITLIRPHGFMMMRVPRQESKWPSVISSRCSRDSTQPLPGRTYQQSRRGFLVYFFHKTFPAASLTLHHPGTCFIEQLPYLHVLH